MWHNKLATDVTQALQLVYDGLTVWTLANETMRYACNGNVRGVESEASDQHTTKPQENAAGVVVAVDRLYV